MPTSAKLKRAKRRKEKRRKQIRDAQERYRQKKKVELGDETVKQQTKLYMRKYRKTLRKKQRKNWNQVIKSFELTKDAC